jgi:hypothetical protein
VLKGIPAVDYTADELLYAPRNPRSSHAYADSDEAGHAFQSEGGHLFRREAGRYSDLKPATLGVVSSGLAG